jgi:hypothetical protein
MCRDGPSTDHNVKEGILENIGTSFIEEKGSMPKFLLKLNMLRESRFRIKAL